MTFSEAAMIMMSGGGKVIQPLTITANGSYEAPEGVNGFNPVLVNVPSGFTLYDAANLPTIAEYTAGNSKLKLNLRENGYQSISISMGNYSPINYYNYHQIYSVWYYKNTPFLAVPTGGVLQKQIDYRTGSKAIYIFEIDLYKDYKFTAPVLPDKHSQSTSVSLKYTYTYDATTFDEDGSQLGHSEYGQSGSTGIYPFRTYGSYGSPLMSIEENPSEYTEFLTGFCLDFHFS